MFPQGSAELFCTHASAFAHVNVPSCPTVFCEALAPMHAAWVCASLLFLLFVHAPSRLCQCMRGASIGKPVQSAVLCCPRVWIPRVCCSAILRASIVSGLFPPYPPLFSTVSIIYQCDRCPSSLFRGSP